MNLMISSYLEEVEEREQAATTGPWKEAPIEIKGWESYKMVAGSQRSAKYRDFIRSFDAEFMAHARNDVMVLHQLTTDLLEFINKLNLSESEKEALSSRLTRRIQMGEA